MLTRLRFKNWRSLRDVEINDLTPITVFIGANSSGKTNIIDALRFYRDSNTYGLLQPVSKLGYTKIQTSSLENNEDVELEFTYKLALSSQPITDHTILRFHKRDVPFEFRRQLYEGDKPLLSQDWHELPRPDVNEITVFSDTDEREKLEKRRSELSNYFIPIVQCRWQILGDSFVPVLSVSGREGGDLYLIEPDGRNTLFILDFMRQAYRDIYNQLEDDLTWLLQHVTGVGVSQDNRTRDLELLIWEEDHKHALTISTGTARLVTILTAIYALEMPQETRSELNPIMLKPSMPGLIVIEEPDIALNPGLLRNFVEQLRNYVDREDRPRQFILTTHNPSFLDLFEPEEVRVVERDEHGYTTVKKIPDHIREIWLDKYGLGEVWTTRSFGGVPGMSGTIWLIVEGENDSEIVKEIVKRKYPSVRIEPIKTSGTKRMGISPLAEQIEELIKTAIAKKKPGDCIAVLHDVDLQTNPHNREPYERVKIICNRYKKDVKRIEARDTIESWLLANQGLCKWLNIPVERWDEKPKPKEELKRFLDKADKPKYKQRNLAKILAALDATGDKVSPSLSKALKHLENAPCVQETQ